MLNTLFLEGVPDERKNVACSRLRDFTASSLLSESLEHRLKESAASIFSLKKIHPQGTRDSAEGIRTKYRWERV